MVSAGMELSGALCSADLMDFLAHYGGGEDDPGGRQEAPPAVPPAETLSPPSSLHLEGDFLPESLEGAGSNPERPNSGSSSSEGADHCPQLSPPCPESLDVLSETRVQPWQKALQPGSPKSQGSSSSSSSNEDTQALFWASILQAQRCVLDLEGEIDRQREPAEKRGPPASPASQDLAASHEPLLLESDSEDEDDDSVERQEEEDEGSEEEEEMEHLFYNNPLFQESPRPGTTSNLDGLALWGCSEGDASTEEAIGIAGSGLVSEALFCQARVSTSPVARASLSAPEGEAAADDLPGSLVPTYMPHYRSLSPLVITEGDAESVFPSVEERVCHDCFPDQLAHSPSGSVLESMDAGLGPAGAEVPGEGGLLFSAASTSLVSALLLHEPQESWHPPKPPTPTPTPPPAESRLAPSSTQAFPAPAAEQSLVWQLENFRPPVPPRSHPSPACAWVEEPDSASCLEEEVATTELLSSALSGVGRKLESSAEGLEMVEVPSLHGSGDDEPLAAEEEEEELLAPHCPEEEPSLGPSQEAEGTLHPSQQAEPDGAALLANGTSGDQAAARRLAARLYHLDGFKRSQVASFLRKNNEFSQMVAEAFLSFFQFGGQTLGQALRSFLKAFVLTGETQERERILRHFSQRYHDCNPEVFRSSDAVHTLTCAIMLLNTDLHGQNVGRSMTCQEFLANLEGLNDGQNFPKEQLKELYHSIRHEKLEWAMDEQDAPGPSAPQPAAPGNALSLRKNNNPFLTLSHDPAAQIYRQGPLARKVHAEADGKKTPWGKRGWKVFHTVLKGVVLYFFKDESRPDVLGAEEPIGVHHALAEKACQYTKRPHVFRLQTADWRIVLFQASTPEEMNSWISRINLVAAMFSSPPFPAAVGSQRKFIRPILPTAPSKSSLEDQQLAHERWVDKRSDELLEHQRNLPDKHGRGRDLEEYQLKKEYLLYEKRRYETYVRLLEAKLNSATDDLSQWEARLGEVDESHSLKKSHSSPSLNVDGLPAGAKVKRNISERRTVRKIIPRRNKHLL